MKTKVIMLGVSIAAACAIAEGLSVETLSPQDGATVALVRPEKKAFAQQSREKRRADFVDKEKREAIRKIGSLPLPVELSWKCKGGNGVAPLYTVTVYAQDGRPVFWGESSTNKIDVWNLEIARRYVWKVWARNGEEVASASGFFNTEDVAPRDMNVEGVTNFRDFGGWIGLDGRRVKQGLVFRSTGLNNNAHSNFYSRTEVMKLYDAGKLVEKFGEKGAKVEKEIREGKAKPEKLRKTFVRSNEIIKGTPRVTDKSSVLLLDGLGIKTDIDLRSDYECWGMKGSPLGPRVAWQHISSGAYASMKDEWAQEAFKKDFRLFLDEANYPILFHCIGGADRTGTLAFILNGILGVDEEELIRDWEYTLCNAQGQYFKHKNCLDGFYKVLSKYPGATVNERIEAYVLSLGFTKDDIEKFRRIMLEPKKNEAAKRKAA